MEDYTPIGGTWQQDISYRLKDLSDKFSEKEFCCNVEVVTSAITATSVVEVITNIYQQQDTVFIPSSLPIISPQDNQTIVYTTNYIKPEPKVIDVGLITAYQRCCGDAYSIDSKYINCRNCVDKWLQDHKDGFELKQLTSSGTGCSINKPKAIDCGSCRKKKRA